ncbi:hypothetical protein GCM10010277_60550 [Streptomyces longisporoflavus]|nr:hypothetical protein GCM10010277_60550 [Streptomyces longisporoflavus]
MRLRWGEFGEGGSILTAVDTRARPGRDFAKPGYAREVQEKLRAKLRRSSDAESGAADGNFADRAGNGVFPCPFGHFACPSFARFTGRPTEDRIATLRTVRRVCSSRCNLWTTPMPHG